MKKRVFNVLAIAAVAALLFLNVNVVLNSKTTSYLKLGAISLAQADDSGSSGGAAGYKQKTVNNGEVKDTANLNGYTYTRTCKYTQTICTGNGTVSCTPALSVYDCTAYVLGN